MRKYMILFGILFLIILSYSVNADWHSSSFGGSVTVEEPTVYTWHNSSFGGSVTVVDYSPTFSGENPSNESTDVSISLSSMNVTINDPDGDSMTIDWYYDDIFGDDTWTHFDHFTSHEANTSNSTTNLSWLTLYNNVYEIKVTANDGLTNNSYIWHFTTEEEPSYIWHNSSFGGSVEVLDIPINTSISPTTWIAGSNNVGTSVQENFTFYQNGSSNLDITIGINTTNFSFVDYTTYESSGYNQVCSNFTTDSWSSETNISDTSYPFSTSLQSDFAPGNFTFGVRIWMPKMLDAESVNENFELILSVSEHT